ncbi:MAG: 23S rRNA (guanosine(2251)-2'-O)-methyltransferase RlmB [Actinomycetota bacterium]
MDSIREHIYGINPVYLALTRNAGSRKIYRLLLNRDRKKTDRINRIKDICLKENIQIQELGKKEFESFARNSFSGDFEASQGIALEASPYNYYDLDHYIESGFSQKSYLVMLDGVTDVGNFGAIIRNCSAFGADGLIIAKKRSVQVTGRVDKVSAGALEGVRVFRVANLVRTIKNLKESSYWVYGSESEKGKAEDIEKVSLAFPLLLVMGSEEKGISRLVARNCDYLVNIGMSDNMESLNVSVASGIILNRVYREIGK